MVETFTKGEVVKAFVKLGVQRQHSWTKMIYQKKEGLNHIVEFHDQIRVASHTMIRKYKPIADQDYDAVIANMNESFPALVAMIQRAATELLPERWNKVKVDDENKIVYLANDCVCISAGIVEVVRQRVFGESVEIASWVISSFHTTPETHEQPSEVEEVEEGNDPDIAKVVALAIEKVYKSHVNEFWQSIFDEKIERNSETQM